MYAVRTQLSWTHLRSLMSVSNALARQFYMEMCRIEHWSTRTLDEKIDAQLFERTAISRKPDEVIKAELEKSKEKAVISLICSDCRMYLAKVNWKRQY